MVSWSHFKALNWDPLALAQRLAGCGFNLRDKIKKWWGLWSNWAQPDCYLILIFLIDPDVPTLQEVFCTTSFHHSYQLIFSSQYDSFVWWDWWVLNPFSVFPDGWDYLNRGTNILHPNFFLGLSDYWKFVFQESHHVHFV